MSSLDDVLPLPKTAAVHLLAPDMLILRGIVPEWRNELIRVAENTDRWKQSTQVRHNDQTSYVNTFRTSRSLMISHLDPIYGACLWRFERALVDVFHTGVLAYGEYNRFLNVTDDSGYELLRYREGERFGLHTDAILGRNEAFRQISAILYLNDDYTGGETEFPRQGIKVKGRAGDLLMFPSNFCYPHEALPVTRGTKYAIVTWFVAFPKKDKQEGNHGEAEADCGRGVGVSGNNGLCDQSARGGLPPGGTEAHDREHPASVGGCAQSRAEA